MSSAHQQPVDPQGNKQIAILFTDMKGSSAFYKAHGNIAGRIMIQKLNDMLFPIVRAYRGTVVKTIGDAIMAYFHAPPDALWTAIAMQKRLHAHNRDNNKPGEQLLIRVAMNYGVGIVEEKDVFGDVVNVAGKLIASCREQQILITDSFYREVKNLSEVTFKAVKAQKQAGLLSDIHIYQVEWDKIEDANTNIICLLSLDMDTGEQDSAGALKKVESAFKKDALTVIRSSEREINASYSSPKAALKAARSAINTCLASSGRGSELPVVVRTGLHSVSKSSLKQSPPGPEHFAAALAAARAAEPYEIMLTGSFHKELSSDMKSACSIRPSAESSAERLYTFSGDQAGGKDSIFTALIPDSHRQTGAMPCFYCGSTQHPGKSCPSKPIRKPTNSLEKLAYTPIANIREMFQQHFFDITRPLESKSDEQRYGVLFNENLNDPFSISFFSFYEITQLFQLRSLAMLYKDKPGSPAAQKSGALFMGEDCLRVARFEEANSWFEKALAEQPQDHRPHVLQAILSIERGNAEQAHYHFERALSFSLAPAHKHYITLLAARVFEISGNLENARQEVDKVVQLSREWDDAKYYQGVLNVKSGNTKQGLEIFKRLIDKSPRYYLMVSLNPELQSAKTELIAFLNRELMTIRERARLALASIQKTISKYRPMFADEDTDYRAVRDRYEKAEQTFKEESIAGLMDIPAIDMNIQQLISRALDFRQGHLRKRVSDFRKVLGRHNTYLESYPYPNMISDYDRHLSREFSELLDEARSSADTSPPPSLKKTKETIEEMQQLAAQLRSRRNRLELIKKTVFTFECLGKLCGIFSITTIITTLLFSVVLMLYQSYEGTLTSLNGPRLVAVFKFGAFAGMVFGLLASCTWLAKNYNDLHKKIEL